MISAEAVLLEALDRVRAGDMEFFILVGTIPGVGVTGSFMWAPTDLQCTSRLDLIQGLKKVTHELENPAICASCRQLMSHPYCFHCLDEQVVQNM